MRYLLINAPHHIDADNITERLKPIHDMILQRLQRHNFGTDAMASIIINSNFGIYMVKYPNSSHMMAASDSSLPERRGRHITTIKYINKHIEVFS
jgi:hypothetical protein